MKLIEIVSGIKSWKKKNIREGAISEAAAVGGLIWGSYAAYFGFHEAFVDYPNVNTALKIAGVAGIAYGITHFGNRFYNSVLRPIRKTNEYIRKIKQKQEKNDS